MKIIPTVFAKNKREFDKYFKIVLELGVKDVQIDFMDGKFVGIKGVKLESVPSLKSKKQVFEAHLMVEHPEKWLPGLKKKGFKRVLFHYGAYDDVDKVLWAAKKAKEFGLKAGVVFNPAAPFKETLEISKKVKHIMFMGHIPGVEGRPLNPMVLEKIKKLRKNKFKGKIQVDGSVNPRTIKKFKKVGVNIVNVGSFISASENPKRALIELKNLIK